MTDLPASFFVRADELGGDAFRATIATRGPWSPVHQHGGPPAALLARALERFLPGPRAARLSIVFHKPIAIDVLRVTTTLVRDGKKVKIARAELVAADDRPVATAEALFIRRAEVGVTASTDELPRDPAVCEPYVFPFFADSVGYHVAMEARRFSGVFGRGEMGLWMRMRIPLVPGETPTQLQRVACAADSGNGVSVVLDLAKYTFVNPDLTVALSREPDADNEWVGLDARTRLGSDGIGLAESRLLDPRGCIGRGIQTLVLERRPSV